MRMLQTHVPVHMTSSFFTRPFLTVPTNTMYVCVFVLIHFQERFLIDEFSMKTLSVLVWTEGLNASKCMRFNRKHIRMDGTRISLLAAWAVRLVGFMEMDYYPFSWLFLPHPCFFGLSC